MAPSRTWQVAQLTPSARKAATAGLSGSPAVSGWWQLRHSAIGSMR
jgi:hypothetical protein